MNGEKKIRLAMKSRIIVRRENLFRFTLREINSLSCLFYIDLKSFFEGGNYHKKAMNFLSSNVRTNFFLLRLRIDRKITQTAREIDFQRTAKLCTGLLCRLLINLMITAFINHWNNVPCALRCASIITIERNDSFPISQCCRFSLSVHLISILKLIIHRKTFNFVLSDSKYLSELQMKIYLPSNTERSVSSNEFTFSIYFFA